MKNNNCVYKNEDCTKCSPIKEESCTHDHLNDGIAPCPEKEEEGKHEHKFERLWPNTVPVCKCGERQPAPKEKVEKHECDTRCMHVPLKKNPLTPEENERFRELLSKATSEEKVEEEGWEKEFDRLADSVYGYIHQSAHRKLEDFIRSKREQWEAAAYERGQADAFRGHIQGMKSITISEEVNIVPELRKYIEAAAYEGGVREGRAEAIEEYEAYLGCIGEDIGNILAIEPKNWKHLLGNITTQIAVIINPTPQ